MLKKISRPLPASILFILFLFLLFLAGTPALFAQPIDPPGLLHAPPCNDPDLLPDQAQVPCSGILVFPEGSSPESRAAKIEQLGAILRFNYHSVHAAAVHIPDEGVLSNVLSDNEIIQVIPDRPVHANPKPDKPGKGNNGGGGNEGQVVDSGVARIGAAPGLLPVDGTGVGVAIVDTGLDSGHADLNVAPECFTAYSDCEDGEGHGTHVGGIVAALNNDQDTVGVAPGATLYAVRVLDPSGNGSDATVMAGLDWIAQNANTVNPPIDVVNMSLGREGSLDDNPPLRESIRVLTEDMGISVVTSAGNDSDLEVIQNVPATYPEVMAIASTTAEDGNNQCKFFSGGSVPADTASFFTTDGALDGDGIGVTISAPGASHENIKRSCFIQSIGILSLKAGGGTTRLSGTSMSSPHVAGVIALMIQQGVGPLDPESIRDQLRNTASGIGLAPLDSPASSYTFDGEREGVVSACGALNFPCL